MTRLLVATRSLGKQRELRELLRPIGFDVVFPDDIGMLLDPAEDRIECHDTFEGNARAKARWFASRSGMRTLADDSGLEVDALAGAPGVRSKRFAGLEGPDHVVADANIDALLDRLRDVPDAQRTACYRTVLVLSQTRPDGAFDETVAEGVVWGRIAHARQGAGGFGYDPLFIANELQITFGEASPDAKARVSHRARAVAALAPALGAILD